MRILAYMYVNYGPNVTSRDLKYQESYMFGGRKTYVLG